MVLHWPRRLLTAEDLRRHLNGQRELVVGPRTVLTPSAEDELRMQAVSRSTNKVEENGRVGATWGFTQEQPFSMVASAVQSLARNGIWLSELPRPVSPICQWARDIAKCIVRGECKGAAVFCFDPGLVCCIANKVAGVRSVAVCTTTQAARASLTLGANLLAVEMPGRTYFEIREIMRQLCESKQLCPDVTANTLKELENHANR